MSKAKLEQKSDINIHGLDTQMRKVAKQAVIVLDANKKESEFLSRSLGFINNTLTLLESGTTDIHRYGPLAAEAIRFIGMFMESKDMERITKWMEDQQRRDDQLELEARNKANIEHERKVAELRRQLEEAQGAWKKTQGELDKDRNRVRLGV